MSYDRNFSNGNSLCRIPIFYDYCMLCSMQFNNTCNHVWENRSILYFEKHQFVILNAMSFSSDKIVMPDILNKNDKKLKI